MTKAEIVNKIAKKTNLKKTEVLETMDAFIKVIKNSLIEGENVYLSDMNYAPFKGDWTGVTTPVRITIKEDK